MHATALLALALFQQPHLVADPYPQLPVESVCQACYHQCEADRCEITARLEVVTGWQRQRYLQLRCESDRLAAIWYACWWLRWSKVRADDQEEWAERLGHYVGAEAFWSGRLPLLLSVQARP